MIGPGTGVAPFRGFVQERAKQAREGVNVGKAILFIGCRRADEDLPIRVEESLGERFELITAFSRQGPEKVYVQHRLREHSRQVGELLRQGAFIYVCGDAANMAREVNVTLAEVIAGSFGIDEAKDRKS